MGYWSAFSISDDSSVSGCLDGYDAYVASGDGVCSAVVDYCCCFEGSDGS